MVERWLSLEIGVGTCVGKEWVYGKVCGGVQVKSLQFGYIRIGYV
jgi:hypothetical protein